jgi:hypothetical protein
MNGADSAEAAGAERPEPHFLQNFAVAELMVPQEWQVDIC